jgi:hypothetical protein
MNAENQILVFALFLFVPQSILSKNIARNLVMMIFSNKTYRFNSVLPLDGAIAFTCVFFTLHLCSKNSQNYLEIPKLLL